MVPFSNHFESDRVSSRVIASFWSGSGHAHAHDAGGIRALLMPVEGDAAGTVLSGVEKILSDFEPFEVIRTQEVHAAR